MSQCPRGWAGGRGCGAGKQERQEEWKPGFHPSLWSPKGKGGESQWGTGENDPHIPPGDAPSKEQQGWKGRCSGCYTKRDLRN